MSLNTWGTADLFRRLKELEDQNAELLEALEAMLLNPWASVNKARAAIAKHKGKDDVAE